MTRNDINNYDYSRVWPVSNREKSSGSDCVQYLVETQFHLLCDPDNYPECYHHLPHRPRDVLVGDQRALLPGEGVSPPPVFILDSGNTGLLLFPRPDGHPPDHHPEHPGHIESPGPR